MSPFSLPVLAGTAVVGSPALYAALGSDNLSTDVALTRLVVCALGVWGVCSLVAALASKAVATNEADAPGGQPDAVPAGPAAPDAAAPVAPPRSEAA